MSEADQSALRSGFVALLGRPNVGKSTLLNTALGTKLSAVTPRPQTTRDRILGVCDRPAAQIVFIDTPGVHRARSQLNQAMVATAYGSILDADAALLLVEVAPLRKGATPSPGGAERAIIERLQQRQVPCVLALNKIDRVKPPALLAYIDTYRRLFPFEQIVPVCATRGDGIETVLQALEPLLPEGPRLFPEDQLSDRAVRFFVAELVREQIFLQLHQEVPYGCAVVVERFLEPRAPGAKPEIDATIVVEQDRHKGIMVGRRGQRIKALGISSRAAVEELLDQPVVLRLHVRVRRNWTRDPAALRELGYLT